MPAYYTFAKVCVMASWFETTGLTLLEALFCGTNAVASSPRAKEILGDYASYCKPWDVESIKKAIGEQFYAKRPQLDESMRQEYTWENAAKKTYKVYKTLLEK
jgi:glycosyltransferase involved in cell wall biosynthesis